MTLESFDYQSDRHCAKTFMPYKDPEKSLITSQIDTAPKLLMATEAQLKGLITSQIDTAPKHSKVQDAQKLGLITSQIDTAPKPSPTASVALVV